MPTRSEAQMQMRGYIVQTPAHIGPPGPPPVHIHPNALVQARENNGEGDWANSVKALLDADPPGSVDNLHDLLSKFDDHNPRAKNVSEFARNLKKMCSAFSDKFSFRSRPEDFVGAPFLWLLLVKLGQYLRNVPKYETSTLSQLRKTMNAVWFSLGQSTSADLEALRNAPRDFLKHDGLTRASFFPGPLKEICDEGRSPWESIRELYFLRADSEFKRAAVEGALTVYAACDIIGKRLGDGQGWRFNWETCLEAFHQNLGERVPVDLHELLANKKDVLRTVADTLRIESLAQSLSRHWDPSTVAWCASEVIHESSSSKFWNSCIEHMDLGQHGTATLIRLVQDVQWQFPAGGDVLKKLLVRIAQARFGKSLLELLVIVVIPCRFQLSAHRTMLDKVAGELRFDEEALPWFTEQVYKLEWLQWLFKLLCDKAAHALSNTTSVGHLDASVKMVGQMSGGLERMSLVPNSVTFEKLCVVQLEATISTLKRFRIDPLPSLMFFLAKLACQAGDASLQRVADLVLEGQRTLTKDSSGWQYLCHHGINGPIAEHSQAPPPNWILVLAGRLASQYCDAINIEPRGLADGLLREIQEPILTRLVHCNRVVQTVIGVVCLRTLSRALVEVIDSVQEGSYDISTSLAALPTFPLLLQVLNSTLTPLESIVNLDDIETWRQFKQTVDSVLTMNCHAITRVQLVAMSQSRPIWEAMAAVLGYNNVPVESWATADFDLRLAEVQQAADVAGWLARFDVEGAAKCAAYLAGGPTDGLTMEKLADKQRHLKNYLQPISEHVDLIVHCRRVNSIIFEVAITRLLQDVEDGQIDTMSVRERVRECDRQLRELLSREMRLENAKLFFQQKGMNISQEVEKLLALGRYEHYTSGKAQHCIEKALEMLQYSTETQDVAELIKQYHLLEDPENDVGFKQLQETQRNHGTRSLADAPSEFKRLQELLSARNQSLTGVHFQLFRKLQECPEVIAFFRETQFVTTQQGCQRFEQARQHLAVELETQDLETKVLNDLLEVRNFITPFVSAHQSFSDFVGAVLALPDRCLGNTGLIPRLDLIQANIGRVKGWFQSAFSTKAESAGVQAKMVNECVREILVLEQILRLPAAAAGTLSAVKAEAFAKMICVCQHEFGTILSESSVSHRDVRWCLAIFSFFWKLQLPAGVEDAEDPNEKLERCMVLSLSTVYYSRIADDGAYGNMPGSDLRQHLDKQLRPHVPSVHQSFRDEVDQAVDRIICSENFHVPEGVALNGDLKENLLACLISVETNVPVCLLGPPGRSKTLAFEVLTQNLLGPRTTFCRGFPVVDPIVYQCHCHSSGEEISSVLQRAAEREVGYRRDGGSTRCVVFLDGGCLPPSQCSLLHDALDDGNLPIILTAQHKLDSANQGRMLTLVRQVQTQEEYELVGRELLLLAGSSPPQQLLSLVRGLAKAFSLLRQRFPESFTDRDFISLLRHLRAEAADEGGLCPTPASLLRGLENNFLKPGVTVQVVAEIFFAELSNKFAQDGLGDFPLPVGSFRRPLEIMEDCVKGGYGRTGHRGVSLRSQHPHLAPRFCMILSDGEGDAVVRVLSQEGFLPSNLEMLQMPTNPSQGEDDVDTSGLQHCMESGQPVLLSNASRILHLLFNLLDQGYRVAQTDEGEQLLYSILPHKRRARFCRVHPDFFMVLHMSLAEFAGQPEPLRSRFAQVQVTVDEVLEMRLAERLPAEEHHQQRVREAFERCKSFVAHAAQQAGAPCFVGQTPLQTLESLCLLHLDCFVEALAEKPLPSKISPLCDLGGSGVELAKTGLDGAVQTVLLHLLQIARPESLLQCLGTLGNEKLYRRAYFQSQQHFCLRALVRSVMLCRGTGLGKFPKLLIQTKTSSEVLNLLAMQGGAFPDAHSDADLWAEIGFGFSSSDVHVLDVAQMDLTAQLEDQVATGVTKRLVLLGVDMRACSNSQVTWLRGMLDRLATKHPDVLFVVLLHFPPEVVVSGSGLYPCAFVDRWEFFWLDSLGFQTPFTKDLVRAFSGETTRSSPPSFQHDISKEVTTAEFAKRAKLALSSRPPLVADDAAARFYEAQATTRERAVALREVLDQQPALWRELVAVVQERCQGANLNDGLMKMAEKIHKGEQLTSLMNAALFPLQHPFDSMALFFLAQLCSNEGLVGLAENATGAAAALLRLIPVPACGWLPSTANISVHNQQSRAGLSPLFSLLHQHLSRHLKRFGLLTHSAGSFSVHTVVLNPLQRRIEEDPLLREFCTRCENETLRDYARFLLLLTCGRSLSPRVTCLVLNWMVAGACGAEICAPAALAQLVETLGFQGGRLRNFARLNNLLEEVKCLDAIEGIPAADAAEGKPWDLAGCLQKAEMWRGDIEMLASETVAEAAWDALLRCGDFADSEGRLASPWEWIGLSLRVESIARTANECAGSFHHTTSSKRRPIMRMFAAVLPGLENARKVILAQALCARLDGAGEIEEASTWLIETLIDLLAHEPGLLKQTLALLLLGLLDEKNIWSKETWVTQLFSLVERKVAPAAGAESSQEDFLIPDELALLLLRELWSMTTAGAQRSHSTWPQLKCFLESQGMRSCYLPCYCQRRRANADPVPRVADLLFKVYCLEFTEHRESSPKVLRSCFMDGQRCRGSQTFDRSILACAHGYAFAIKLGRWLCAAHTIDEDLLEPIHELLQEASASILPLHAVPLASEMENRGGGAFLQALLRNGSIVKALPRIGELIREAGLRVPDEEALRVRCSPLPLCLTAVHSFSPLGDLRPQYKWICDGIAAALLQNAPQVLSQALEAVAAEPLSAGHANGLLLLAIYHEFYSEQRNPELQPLLGWLPVLLPDIAQEELRFFKCLIAPATQQLGYHPPAGATQNDLNAAFALDCKDPLQVVIRHSLVNMLALSFFVPAAKRDHFWMHVNTPGDLHRKLAFGSSRADPVGVVYHYDCGCVFEFNGSFRHSEQCPHWPLQAATASFVHCYGGFCLNYLVDPQMHQALFGSVLTPSSIKAGGREHYLDMGGARPEDETVQFCYQRVWTSALYLQATLGLNPEEQCILLTLISEKGISKQLAGTSSLRFQYDSDVEKRAAEVEFRDAFLDTLAQRAEILEALRQNGAERLKKLCPRSFPTTGSTFEAALARAPATPALQVLRRFSAMRSELELVSLIPPLLRLYLLIHEELNEHFQGSLTVGAAAEITLFGAVEEFAHAAAVRTAEQRQRSRRLREEGKEAFNTLVDKLGGRLAIDCGRVEMTIQKITPETSLLLLLSSQQAPSSENVLYRAVEYLMGLRQDFLNAVETVASDPAAPGELQRIPALLGNARLEHLSHTPLALADECRLTVPNFAHRARATQRSDGDFDLELLLPTVLRASVVGKSRWTLQDFQREFLLKQPRDAICAAASTWQGKEGRAPWASLPASFRRAPVGDARTDIEACLEALRKSELLEFLVVLCRASVFMQRWHEAESASQFAGRLHAAGFDLPSCCQQAFQRENIRIEHTGFILRELHERLQGEAFTFAHLHPDLRKPLPAGVGAKLDDLFESSFQHPAAVAEVIAHLSSSEDGFLQQQARPLVAVLSDMLPEAPAHVQEVLAGLPREVLCRHLFEALLKLLALRFRLDDVVGSNEAGTHTKWWESAAARESFPTEIAAAAAPEEEELPEKVIALLRRCLQRRYRRLHAMQEEMEDLEALPQGVLVLLRRCLQRRYRCLHARPATWALTMEEPRPAEMEDVEEGRNPCATGTDAEAAGERREKERRAQSVLLRCVQRWLRRRRQRSPSTVAITGSTSPANACSGQSVEVRRVVCPEEFLSKREGLPVDENVMQDPTRRASWRVCVGGEEVKYMVTGTRLFRMVCNRFGLPTASTSVISGAGLCAGLCEDDPEAPTHSTIRYVSSDEIFECDALGERLRFHCNAKLEALAARVLQQQPGMDSCCVANSSLRLQPLTSRLADIERPVHVMDGGGPECWCATVADSSHHLALTATVESLISCGPGATGANQTFRLWSPSLGVLTDSDQLQDIFEGDDVQHLSFVPTDEITSLRIDAFGVSTEVEVHQSATAAQVVQLLWRATSPVSPTLPHTSSRQMVLLAGDHSLEPEDLVASKICKSAELRLATVASVSHPSQAAGPSRVNIVAGTTAGSLLAQLNYTDQKFLFVDSDHRIIAATTELWKMQRSSNTLSISTTLRLSASSPSGEVTDLQLGRDACLSSICKAVEDAGLPLQDAVLLWAYRTSRCSLIDPAACYASLLDFHDELTPSCPEEARCQQVPRFVVTEAVGLLRFTLKVVRQEGSEGREPDSVVVVASKESQLCDLQVQLATFLHLPLHQFELRGGAGDLLLDGEDSLSEAFEILNPNEEPELAVLRFQRLPATSAGHITLQICSADGNPCQIQTHRDEPATQLWRSVRWHFGLPPFDFGKGFSFNHHEVGELLFTDEWTVQELYDLFKRVQCEAATVACADICGAVHSFTLDWRVVPLS